MYGNRPYIEHLAYPYCISREIAALPLLLMAHQNHAMPTGGCHFQPAQPYPFVLHVMPARVPNVSLRSIAQDITSPLSGVRKCRSLVSLGPPNRSMEDVSAILSWLLRSEKLFAPYMWDFFLGGCGLESPTSWLNINGY